MSQIDQFLVALKRSLKNKGILYRDLAKALELSESSVKRILSSKSLSLERLEEICRVADLSFAEIVKDANFEESDQPVLLTDEQESALAENARLLHYFMMLQEGKTVQQIEKEYMIPLPESKKYLFQLDKLQLIELHPRDRVKMKKQGALRFRRDGPVGKALFAQTKQRYLNYDFRNEDYIRFTMVKISTSTVARYKAKLERLLADILEESKYEIEHGVPVVDSGILMAIRPWKYSYMDAIEKK